MHRFLVSPAVLAEDPLALEGDIARQVAVVLRLRAGEEVVLLDGGGEEVRALLEVVTPRRLVLRPLERGPNRAEACTSLHLYPALLRGPRFELVVQKATELGVAAITPFLSRRSVARWPAGDGGVPERWRSIAREATEQCGRGRLPALAPPVPFGTACAQAAAADLAICCAERGGADLGVVLAERRPRSLAVLIGPEGGLDLQEVGTATGVGIIPVWLGPRLLRAETAAVAACAAAYCLLGEWRPGVADRVGAGRGEGARGDG